MKCYGCNQEKSSLVCLQMYGYLCGICYQDIIRDYLK